MKKKNLSKLSLKKSTVSELNNSNKIIGAGIIANSSEQKFKICNKDLNEKEYQEDKTSLKIDLVSKTIFSPKVFINSKTTKANLNTCKDNTPYTSKTDEYNSKVMKQNQNFTHKLQNYLK